MNFFCATLRIFACRFSVYATSPTSWWWHATTARSANGLLTGYVAEVIPAFCCAPVISCLPLVLQPPLVLVCCCCTGNFNFAVCIRRAGVCLCLCRYRSAQLCAFTLFACLPVLAVICVCIYRCLCVVFGIKPKSNATKEKWRTKEIPADYTCERRIFRFCCCCSFHCCYAYYYYYCLLCWRSGDFVDQSSQHFWPLVCFGCAFA